MHLGSLPTWITELQNRAGEFANKTESYIVGALVKFRDKRGELRYYLARLKANPPPSNAPASLKADYNATLTAANDANTKAEWLGKIADTFTNITGLGVLPAVIAGVPLAVMLAAVASLVYIITNITKSVSRYMAARLVVTTAAAQGKDATNALENFYDSNPEGGGGLFGDAAKLVWPIAIVGGIVLYMQAGKRR